MKTRVPKPLYLVPFVYLLMIVFFVFLQFSDIDTMSLRVSSLSAVARVYKLPWEENERLTEIQVFGTGFVFPFTKNNPVRITSMDGLIHKAEPRYYRPLENGFLIRMSQGLEVIISQEEGKNQAAKIQFRISDYSSVKNISLPFSVMREFTVETAGGLPVFSVENKRTGEQTILGLSMGGWLDEPGQRIILPPDKDRLGTLLVEKTDGKTGDLLSHWFSQKQDPISPKQYGELLENYRSLAVESWREGRFDREKQVWTFPDGSSGFTGELGAAFLAESLAGPGYTAAFSRAVRAAEIGFENFGYQAVPYLGDILTKTEIYLRDKEKAFWEMDQKLTMRDLSVFAEDDLYFLAASRPGDPGLSVFSRLIALAETGADAVLDMETAMGLFRFFVDCLENGQDLPASLDYIRSLPEAVFVPGIKTLSEGFFLEKEKNTADVIFSLRAGELLLRAGGLFRKEIYSFLGRELIYSILTLSDSQGNLPAFVLLGGDTPGYRGVLPSEKVYPLIFRHPNYPREHALGVLGPGLWAFSCAGEFTALRRGDTFRLSFTFPVNQSHYVLIQGVEDPARVQLFGVNWNRDPMFQYYHSGWYYDARSKSLFVKIQHRREREEVVLVYE